MKNWKTLSGIAAIVALLVAITACNGYTLADFLKVEVAPDIQEATGSNPTVPLSRAPFVRQRYVDGVTTNLAEYDQNVADAQLFADFAGSLLNTGLSLAEGPLQGIPLGGAIFAALGGAVGLFVKKPGTTKEKEKAFNKGSELAAKRAMENFVAGQKTVTLPDIVS